MELFQLKVGRCFALISNQWGRFDLFVTGRSHFLLGERSLAVNNVMISLTRARLGARIVELGSVLRRLHRCEQHTKSEGRLFIVLE